MLKRVIFGGVLLGLVGAAFQLLRGVVIDDAPMWDWSLVAVMVLTGMAGGYFDYRREVSRRP